MVLVWHFWALPIFSIGWHDARFVAMILWMKMIFLIDKMILKMDGNMNGT